MHQDAYSATIYEPKICRQNTSKDHMVICTDAKTAGKRHGVLYAKFLLYTN